MNILAEPLYIAIDIAKDRLQVQWPDRSQSVPNEETALEAFARQVRKVPGAVVVFEATGGYERPLLQRLWKHHIGCHLVEPSRIKGFAQSEGLKAKTDPIDAKLIWRFACEKRLQAQPPADKVRLQLAEWMDRRGQLNEELIREKNRLHKCTALTRGLIEAMIRTVQKQIAKVDQAITALITQEASLSEQAVRLQSVKGVGPVTTWSVLAYLPEIGHLGRNQLVALAGLAPYNRDSGKKQGQRHIRAGRPKIRKALYMAAQAASIHNPIIKAYVARLRANGKPYKVALTAAMRKLLIHLQTMAKKNNYALD